MKLDPRYKVEKAASRDRTRPHLLNPSLDVEHGRLRATDGHIAADVPVVTGEGDIDGAIPVAACKAARTERGVQAGKDLVAADDVRWVRPLDNPLPPLDQAFPHFGPNDRLVTVSFNPHLLVALAAAIGQGHKGGAVSLTFRVQKDGAFSLEPILVTSTVPDSAKGVLMPVKP